MNAVVQAWVCFLLWTEQIWMESDRLPDSFITLELKPIITI